MGISGRAIAAASMRMRRWAIRRSRHADAGAVLAAARAVMRGRSYCVLVSGVGDESSARVVQPHRPDGELCVRIGTSPDSRKAQQLKTTHGCLLVYLDERSRSSVTLRCAVEEMPDAAKARWFMPGWHAFWPAGPDDDFTVFCCRPERIEVWDLRRGITPPPFGLASAVLELVDGEWMMRS